MDEPHKANAVERKSKRSGRNPDWTWEETVLLMELYSMAPFARENHPEVLALSLLLRKAGKEQGRAALPSFRNPAGITMRLRNFGKLDPQVPPDRNPGIRPGGAIDRRIWAEFGPRPAALAQEAERVRRLFSLGWAGSPAQSSHGPVPHFGIYSVATTETGSSVYLLQIDGPLDILAPTVVCRDGYRVIKIGRTADLERRIAELSSGLPPASQIGYLPIGLRHFENTQDAHSFERALLDLCDRNLWSLGNEFAYAPSKLLRAALGG